MTEWRTRRRLVGVPNWPNTAVISFSPHCSGRPLQGGGKQGSPRGEYRSLLRCRQPALRRRRRQGAAWPKHPRPVRAAFPPHEHVGVVLRQGGGRQQPVQSPGARRGDSAQGLRRRAAGGAGGPRRARPALGREHWAARRAGRRAVQRHGARQGRQGADPASGAREKEGWGRASQGRRREGAGLFTWGAQAGKRAGRLARI